jgi:hypothetical protein
VWTDGCTALAASLQNNTSLLFLKLDGNPVGSAGAKEMVALTLPDEEDAQQYEHDGNTLEVSQEVANSGDGCSIEEWSATPVDR